MCTSLSARSNVNTPNAVICFLLIIDNQDAKEYFKLLEKDQHAIEAELNEKEQIDWDIFDKGKASYISVRTKADYHNRDDWPRQFEWYYDHLLRFRKVFGPRIKALKLSPAEGIEA